MRPTKLIWTLDVYVGGNQDNIMILIHCLAYFQSFEKFNLQLVSLKCLNFIYA